MLHRTCTEAKYGSAGRIPEVWGEQLPLLEHVALQLNGLSGRLPEAWINLENLAFLNLALNQLTGRIPPSWANGTTFTKLGCLIVSSNQLTGEPSVQRHAI